MINFIKTIYHNTKIEILSIPNFFFNFTFTDNEEKNRFYFFKKNHFLFIKNRLDKSTLQKTKTLISDKIATEKSSIYIKDQRVWKIHFLDDFEFLINEIIDHKLISQICNYFQRKNIYIADIDIRRVLPIDNKDIQNFDTSNNSWHKDIRGRQIKLMVYLSDVGIMDSYFSFIPNTSNARTYNFKKSRFRDEEVETKNEKFFIGNQGDAVLFNTNLTHRLNRKESAKIRDSITIYFTPGQHVHDKFLDKKNIFKLKTSIQKHIKIKF